MNHQQQHTRDSEGNMTAATASYNDQMAGGNMAMGMNQQFGGQPNMFGGDSGFYQLDPGTFDSQNAPPIDPNQPPLLNNDESSFIQNFFDDPSNSSVNPFEYTHRPDEKPAANSDSLYGAAIFNHQTGTITPSANVAQSGRSLQKTHVNASGQPTYAGGQQDPLSADDYRAAQTIGNFKTSPSTTEYAPTPSSGGFASWGNFMMPSEANNNMGGMGMDMSSFGAFTQNNNLFQGANQTRSTYNIPQQQQGGQASNIQQQHFYAQPQPAPPPQPPSRNQGTDSASQHVRQQQQSQSSTPFQNNRSSNVVLPHGHGRPPLLQWGSDSGFQGNSRFNASSQPQQPGKEGNLLNIYGAEQAAINGQVQKPGRKSTGRGNSIASPSVPNNAGSWGALGMPASSSSYTRDDQPRKRRKSQADREDEHEWAPSGQSKPPTRIKLEDEDEDDGVAEASTGAAKRRRSTYNRQSVASNSPEAEDDDDEDARKRRGAKKARETLSEAQKRDNHIKSEKKRREIITTGYSDLNRLVPCLAAGKSGLSRSECLQEVSSFMRSLVDGTNSMMNRMGVSDRDWLEWKETAEGRQAMAPYRQQ